jgi:hypothetical protein
VHKIAAAASNADVPSDSGQEREGSIRVEGAQLMRDPGIAENGGGLGRGVGFGQGADPGCGHISHALRPFRRVAMLHEVGAQWLEAKHPFFYEGLIVKLLVDDVVQHRQHQPQIRMRLGRDPLVGLRARRRQARIDDDQPRLVPGALAEEVSKRDRMGLGLVGAEEQVTLG